MPTSPPTPTPLAPTSSPSPGPPDWDALARSLGDRLVRAGDARYDQIRVLYNTRFDAVRPTAIARCASADDVRSAVSFAARHRVPVAVRSGGHSYVGASTGTGLVVDVGPLSAITIADDLVTVGPGAQLIDVYAALAARGRAIAAGSCPTVAIGGLTLGGGLGVLTRAWGLTCDSLVRAEVVTADGSVRTCDERTELDLFWALRGGGGGVGVVTSLTLRTRPSLDLALGFMEWPWARAADVLRGWQAWIAGAADETWSNVHLNGGSGIAPSIRVHAVHAGSATALAAALDALDRSVGVPADRAIVTRSYLDTMRLEAGCANLSLAECHLSPAGRLERETYAASSAVIDRALSDAGIRALVDGMERLRGTANAGGGAAIVDALGGAVARVAPDATAFPHRSAIAVVQMLASWGANAPAPTVTASTDRLKEYSAAVRAHTAGGAYVNYPNADLTSDAYYGGNRARLLRAKATYDPAGVFAL